jgi:hypothetical protein
MKARKGVIEIGKVPSALHPPCFWHQSLFRRQHAKMAESMGVKCIGLLN